jgi:hypothetical protein
MGIIQGYKEVPNNLIEMYYPMNIYVCRFTYTIFRPPDRNLGARYQGKMVFLFVCIVVKITNVR